MKQRILFVALFVCVLHPAFAKDDPALRQTLLAAIQQSNLVSGQAVAFRMDVDFVAHFRSPLQGHLTFEWAAKDRWRRKVVIGDNFAQVEVRNGDWRYIRRNIKFTPTRVSDLFDLLGLNSKPQSWTESKDKHRVVQGVAADCIHAERVDDPGQGPQTKSQPHEVCIRSDSNDILSDEWHYGGDELRERKFDEYVDFASHRYPRKLQLLVNGESVITAEVKNLEAVSFDESHFTPPADAVARRDCDDLRQPVLSNAPEISFSPSARAAGGGKVEVTMTVNLDGTPGDIELSDGTGIPLDAATLKTLQAYRFKPAMCGIEPVVSDITILVEFKIE